MNNEKMQFDEIIEKLREATKGNAALQKKVAVLEVAHRHAESVAAAINSGNPGDIEYAINNMRHDAFSSISPKFESGGVSLPNE